MFAAMVTLFWSVFLYTFSRPKSRIKGLDQIIYSKTCVKRPSKIDNIKILMTNGSLMKVESIAECSLGAFCNTFDLH